MRINLDVMAFGSMARPFLKDATVCPFGFGRRLKVAKIDQNYRIDKCNRTKVRCSYGSLSGLGFLLFSWIVLIVPPMILPPTSSSLHTFPNAAFILSFEGSPA